MKFDRNTIIDKALVYSFGLSIGVLVYTFVIGTITLYFLLIHNQLPPYTYTLYCLPILLVALAITFLVDINVITEKMIEESAEYLVIELPIKIWKGLKTLINLAGHYLEILAGKINDLWEALVALELPSKALAAISNFFRKAEQYNLISGMCLGVVIFFLTVPILILIDYRPSLQFLAILLYSMMGLGSLIGLFYYHGWLQFVLAKLLLVPLYLLKAVWWLVKAPLVVVTYPVKLIRTKEMDVTPTAEPSPSTTSNEYVNPAWYGLDDDEKPVAKLDFHDKPTLKRSFMRWLVALGFLSLIGYPLWKLYIFATPTLGVGAVNDSLQASAALVGLVVVSIVLFIGLCWLAFMSLGGLINLYVEN